MIVWTPVREYPFLAPEINLNECENWETENCDFICFMIQIISKLLQQWLDNRKATEMNK